MPYQWLPPENDKTTLQLWPHRSLPRRGMVWFIGATAALISLPVLIQLGSPTLWGLLPFVTLAIAGVWWALERSYKDGEILETLTITPGLVSLTRQGPRGRKQDWQANPHWLRLTAYPNKGPVPHYLTLSGNGREVELGAFLSEPERVKLEAELRQRLAALR